MPSMLSRELRRARWRFDEVGYIPFDVAARLMACGFIVHELEAQWARGEH